MTKTCRFWKPRGDVCGRPSIRTLIGYTLNRYSAKRTDIRLAYSYCNHHTCTIEKYAGGRFISNAEILAYFRAGDLQRARKLGEG